MPYAYIDDPQTINKYAYVRNNPLRYVDPDGHLLDTILDVGFIAYDVYKIVSEGATAVNKAALAADVGGATVPFLTGAGAVVRAGHAAEVGVRAVEAGSHAAGAAKTAEGAAHLAEAGKAGESGVAKAVASDSKVTKVGEPPQLAAGKAAHKAEPIRPGEKAEVMTPSGKRMDRYDETKGHIREIKPNNPRQLKAGQKQVEGYRKEMEKATGRPHTTEITPY